MDGEARTYLWMNGVMLSDRVASPTTVAALDAAATLGTPVTWTLVPITTGLAALDLDGDGVRNRDELDACSDPADPASTPGHPSPCRADLAGNDRRIDGADLSAMLGAWGATQGPADLDCSGEVDGADLGALLASWGACGG